MASSAPRYARAFAEVAESAGLDAVAAEQQMRDFAETLAGSGELREFLENPSIEVAKKLKVLDAIAARIGMLVQVRNFVAVILEHHRLTELGEIVTAYRDLACSWRHRLRSSRAPRFARPMRRMRACWAAPSSRLDRPSMTDRCAANCSRLSRGW